MTTQNNINDTASGKNRDTENFPVGSWLIRSDLRPHVHAFDHPLLDANIKVTRLNKFAATLLDEQNTEIPEAVALRTSLKQTGVTPQHSIDLLTAFKRDATQLRYTDWADLIDYCNYSAAPVGRHVLALHGVGQSAWKANDALCNALQIINHIQDCADDYRELDRVYIPLDMLTARNGNTADLSHEKSSEGIRTTLQAMLDLVTPMLEDARDLPRQIPDIRLKCETSVICALAEKIVKLLRKRDPLCDNVKLTKAGKVIGTLTGVMRAWV